MKTITVKIMKKYNLAIVSALALLLVFFVGCDENEADFLDSSNIVAGEEPPGDCEIGHRTQTPGGWGAPAAGNNTGYLRDTYFDEVFPNGLTVGCGGGFTINLTSADAVEAFLPSGGKSASLDQDWVDPTSKDLKNTLAGHLVALTLNNHFDHYLEDFGEVEYLLCDLVLCSGEFAGKSVQQVVNQTNKILGGCASNLTIKEAVDIVSNINENFIDGQIDNGYLCCPKGTTGTLDNNVAD